MRQASLWRGLTGEELPRDAGDAVCDLATGKHGRALENMIREFGWILSLPVIDVNEFATKFSNYPSKGPRIVQPRRPRRVVGRTIP